MTVSKLIEKLKEFNPKSIVILSGDAEGNNFDTLFSMEEGSWYQKDRWYEPCKEDGITPNAVCLWP